MTDMTYALWGRGDITKENAKALLETYIPDNVGTVFWPGVADYDHQGLRTALDWFEVPEFLGEGGAVPTTDIIASLVGERDGEFKDDVQLLALWPADPTHEEFDFIEKVQAEGIAVFDLSRALHELDLSLYSRPDPTKEEKAEARAAAKEATRGRGRPKGSTKLSQNTEAQEADETVTPAPEVPAVVESRDVASVPEVEDIKAAVLNDMLKNTTADLLIAALDTYIEAKVAEILARHANEPVKETERPPFDGPYVGTDTTQYYKNLKTGVYRVAGTTKPRRGEVVENLTQEQIDDLPPF